MVDCLPLILICLPLCSVILPFLTSRDRAFFSVPWIKPGLVTYSDQENVAEMMFASTRANFHTCEWGHFEPPSPVNPPAESSLMNNPRLNRRGDAQTNHAIVRRNKSSLFYAMNFWGCFVIQQRLNEREIATWRWVLCKKNLKHVPVAWGPDGRWRQEECRKEQIMETERS